MMLRTPPARRRSSFPSLSSVVQQGKEVCQSAGAIEKNYTPSPSKRPRRSICVDVEDLDEPFNLRSLHRGSPWNDVQKGAGHEALQFEEFAIDPPRIASREFLDSDDEIDPDLDLDSLRCSYTCRNLVKSDVLTTLDLREKQVLELKATVERLRASYSTSEEERQKLKRQMQGFEQALAAANEREKAWHKQRTQESETYSELIRTQMNRCAELETLLQDEMRRHAEIQAKALELETQATAMEEAKEKFSQSSMRETNNLKQELERVQEDRVLSVARINAELEAEKLHLQGAAAEVERFSTQLKEMQGRLAENLEDRVKLEHQISDAEMHICCKRSTGTSEAELVIKHLKEELSQCGAEVHEARKLKLKHVNVEVLKEQLTSEKVRADQAEAAFFDLLDLESKVKGLERELSEWKEMAAILPGVESSFDVTSKFSELQREVVAAAVKIGETNAEMAKLQTALDLAENAKHQAQTTAESAQAEAAEAVLNLERAKRKVFLLAKERDGLRAILASYDEEESMMASHQNSQPGITNLSTVEKAKDLRIQQLESALADAQQQAKLLEEELKETLKSNIDQRERAGHLTLMFAEMQEKYESVECEAGKLRSEVSSLEAKVGIGESNISNTKVLHMILNPEVEAHGQPEVQALRARLDLHERHFDGCREAISVPETEMDQKQVTVLTHRVTALEKREARYKEVFASKISIFREACGLIFGYKVQMNEEQDSSTGGSITLFTLRSIYSTSEEEKIQFQFKAGNLEMIANEYTAELQRQVTTFLWKYKSIPAFIANLTMEQFTKTTLG